jgi:putative cell wall-binding protein
LSKSRSGAPKRVAAGLLASSLAIFGIALAPSAGAVDDVSGDRIAGINRYATAAAVAGQDDFAGADTAILATGESFPDALAASGLAGANAPAPIILTESNTYSTEAQEALNNLTSITDVIIVGGTAAISQDVEDAVVADGFTVTRVAGTNRYETAAEIAGDIATVGQIDGLDSALIASGTGFADALAGGPIAYAAGLPILLVDPNEIPAATSDAIADLGIEQAIILGGTAAVSDEVAAELDEATGNPSVRVAGENRFATAAEVARFAEAELGWGPDEVFLANGLNFPDALAGGPIGGERNAPIVLLASYPPETEEYLDEVSDTVAGVTCLGGTASCSAEDLDSAVESAENTGNDEGTTPENDTATTRPELVSATVVETRTTAAATATRPAGTYVLYCFDEAITGAPIDATDFHLYFGDGTRFSGLLTDTDAVRNFTSGVSATDNKCAEVIFEGGAAGSATDLRSAAVAGALTLATVDDSAVTGSVGTAADENPEGDAPLTPSGATSAAAGVTAAPDLVSVGNFRAGTTADVTAVDFTFDQAAFVQAGNDFDLVAVDGTTWQCNAPAVDSTTPASGLAAPGGNGTTVITVNCAEPGGPTPLPSTQFTAENTARGVVNPASVGTSITTSNTGGVKNPLQAADAVAGGISTAPDLTLVLFAADALPSTDIVGYVFDEAVTVGGGLGSTYAAGVFGIYNTTGAETLNAAVSCVRSSESNSAVQCGFTDGILSSGTFVGGNVRAGAVTSADTPTQPNAADEEGVAPSAGPTLGAGRTDGPDLTGVAINTVVSPFGNTTYSATYTFDEDTADTADGATGAGTDCAGGRASAGNCNTGENVVLSGLHLVLADGIRLDCSATGASTTGLTARAEDADNTVTCAAFTVSGGAAATPAQIHNAVLGTVDAGAVDDEAGTPAPAAGDSNPEGSEVATGSGGTPAS